MRKTLYTCQKGEGMLEMILCVPLALLILFVGIDVGLSRLDAALVTDAVREGVHNQAFNNADKIYKLSKGNVQIDQAVVEANAKNIADRISNEVSAKRLSLASSDGNNQIKVAVTPVTFDIDVRTGVVKSYQKGSEVLAQYGSPNLNLQAKAPKVRFESDDSY